MVLPPTVRNVIQSIIASGELPTQGLVPESRRLQSGGGTRTLKNGRRLVVSIRLGGVMELLSSDILKCWPHSMGCALSADLKNLVVLESISMLTTITKPKQFADCFAAIVIS